MLILPAIDLRGGRCVRLAQGDFNAETRYGDPVEQACRFADAGAEWIHVVDLDGARDGAARQRALIGEIVRASRLNVQCGGGVRSAGDIAALLDIGVARAVVGSAAVLRPDEFAAWTEAFGAERVCAAFDVRPEFGGYAVATHGWKATSGVLLDAAIAKAAAGVLRHALITDVSRDGMLAGPNTPLYSDLRAAFPRLAVQASGGVSTLADLAALKAAGAAGAVVGRALYEKRFTLEDALAC
ncbi:MAG TPA: 1-(5-phosphoribosyl)-5-[(5-phosphoribosylamino)methylideneamino]imidazole-4-carboxamide isomerase [Parvularcula sp.]|nr:1-(5-phosphoribosyl)-5-[(5-phosphoribosylamino)methylideneamino]imidazole-4-carboxamide isomerase [Parvularcula sp.]HBS33384.1 1-(5-phosphoribosyl)-5-[(5-phosphoribosylamino)methylideneamino]imidazole-4-carboxamide isomerase [Parvularcula sp.]